MRKLKLICCLTLAVGFMMISIGMVIHSENTYAKNTNMKLEEFDIRNMATSANRVMQEDEQKQEESTNPLLKEVSMEISPASVQREEVYEGMTLEEVASQLDKSLKNEIAGKGMFIASKAIELGVDPFVATAIIMHETGCGQGSCSHIARECYNFGGQKGSGCGAYQRFSSIDDGLNGMISNLYRNFYARGLTTVETIGPRYAESGTWVSKINGYVARIRAA